MYAIRSYYEVIKMGQTYNSSYGARLDQLIFDGSYLVGLQASKVS